MTYYAALIAYFFVYEILYLGPFVLIFALFPERLPSILKGILSILFIGALLLASWRSHLAAKSYGNRDMGFWQAHQAAGDELRIQLSFLPVIGSIFGPKDKQ